MTRVKLAGPLAHPASMRIPPGPAPDGKEPQGPVLGKDWALRPCQGAPASLNRR